MAILLSPSRSSTSSCAGSFRATTGGGRRSLQLFCLKALFRCTVLSLRSNDILLAVDTTAEAVATGAIYSKAAVAYTTLARLCRNALMGFVVLGFAVYYARRGMAREVTHKGLFLWQKWPHRGDEEPLRVGLRTSFRKMVRTGVKPLAIGVAAEAAVAAFTLGMVFAVAGFLPSL